MAYKTEHGLHYHERYGCHGATISCGTAGLEPCSDCCHGTNTSTGRMTYADGGAGFIKIEFGDGTFLSLPRKAPNIAQNIDNLPAWDDLDVQDMIQSPNQEEITERLPTIVEVVDAIRQSIEHELADTEFHVETLKQVSLTGSNFDTLLRTVEISIQTLMDAYGVQSPKEEQWKETLRHPSIIETLEEWKEKRSDATYQSSMDRGSDDDPEDEQETTIRQDDAPKLLDMFKQDPAIFDGHAVLINKVAMDENTEDYYILRVIIHESLHNASTAPIEEDENIQPMQVGFKMSEIGIRGIEKPDDRGDNLNEGITEAINQVIYGGIVGQTTPGEWMQSSGRPVQYLLGTAMMRVIGFEKMFPIYISGNIAELNRLVLSVTHGHYSYTSLSNALNNYNRVSRFYHEMKEYIEQQSLSASQDNNRRLIRNLTAQYNRASEPMKEILAYFDSLVPQDEALTPIFEDWHNR